MEDTIVELIRNRVRRISSSHAPIQLTELQLQRLKSVQRCWRRYRLIKALKKLSKQRANRRQVLVELANTEREYLRDLKLLCEDVMKPLESLIDEQMHSMLFINLPELLVLHEEFLGKLEQITQSYNSLESRISPCIMEFTPRLKEPYYKFCLEYRKSNRILKLLKISNSQFNAHIDQLIKQGLMKFELNSYLIKPVQRLCKYSLLLDQLIKYTPVEHPDRKDLEKALKLVTDMVQQTNDQIEEFLRQQRLQSLELQFGNLNNGRKFLFETKVGLVDKQHIVDVDLFLFSDLLMISVQSTENCTVQPQQRYVLDQSARVKIAPDAKYFKNLLCVTTSNKSLTFSCKTAAKREELLRAMQNCLLPLLQGQSRPIEVDVEGTEERKSTFRNYTVYIIKVRNSEKLYTIYPRWSELLDVQTMVGKLFPKLKLPLLEKQDWFSSRKTKTIERRKFAVQEFLTALLNDESAKRHPNLLNALNLESMLEECQSPTLVRKSSAIEESIACLEVMVAGWQPVSCWISSKARVLELKNQLKQMLGLCNAEEFEIFQLKDRGLKLLYEQEVISKFKCERRGLMKMFSSGSTLVYTRSHYLPDEQEAQLFKEDPNRLLFEVAVIRNQLPTYSMDLQLKMTVLALLAQHDSVQVNNEAKLQQFLQGFKDMELPGMVLFRQFCYEIDEAVRKDSLNVQEVLLKVLGQCQLYRSRQYRVAMYQKTFKEIRKQLPTMEQEMVLAIKRTKMLLFTIGKQLVATIDFKLIKEMQVYASSIVFVVQGFKTQLRVDSTQSYEISKLIERYNRDVVTRKLSD